MYQIEPRYERLVRLAAYTTTLSWGVVIIVTGAMDYHALTTLLGWSGLVTAFVWLVVGLALGRNWKRWVFKWLYSDVPNLEGRWEGWYRSEYQNSGPMKQAMEIRQHGVSIAVDAWGEKGNVVTGIAATIISRERNGPVTIISAYYMDPVAAPTDTMHVGVHRLWLTTRNDEDYLVGEYVNNRTRDDKTRGRAGRLELKRTKQPLQNGLGDTDCWAMPICPRTLAEDALGSAG